MPGKLFWGCGGAFLEKHPHKKYFTQRIFSSPKHSGADDTGVVAELGDPKLGFGG